MKISTVTCQCQGRFRISILTKNFRVHYQHTKIPRLSLAMMGAPGFNLEFWSCAVKSLELTEKPNLVHRVCGLILIPQPMQGAAIKPWIKVIHTYICPCYINQWQKGMVFDSTVFFCWSFPNTQVWLKSCRIPGWWKVGLNQGKCVASCFTQTDPYQAASWWI